MQHSLRPNIDARVRTAQFILGLVLFAYPASVAAQCPVAPGPATPAIEWDKTFTQDGPGKGLEPKGSPGWTGGDSTFSILLPGGESAFFFSDSYIAEWPATKGDGTVARQPNGARTTAINCLPPICSPAASAFTARNSIVIRGKDGKHLRTLVGPKDENGLSTSYFKDPGGGIVYWMGDQIILPNKKLIVFLHKFDAKLAFHGASLAQLDSGSMTVEKIVDINLPGTDIHWGSSLVLDSKNLLYIYGKGIVAGKKLPFIARADPAAGIDGLADTKGWKVWNGGSWTPDLKAAAPLVPVTDSVSDEFSVRKFSVNGRVTYIMVAMDTTVPFALWRDITLYSSCTPVGPFTGRHKVYAMPESAARTVPGTSGPIALTGALVVYNPHIHSQFTKAGRILISYNLNRDHNSDSIYIDGYRPRFIWVKIPGLR